MLRLCARQGYRRTVPVQRQRLFANRYQSSSVIDRQGRAIAAFAADSFTPIPSAVVLSRQAQRCCLRSKPLEIVAKPQTFGTEIRMAGDAKSGHKGGNPWHDPKSGRFTSSPVARAAEPGNPPGNNGEEIIVTAPRFRTQGDRPSAGAHHLPPEQVLAAIQQTGVLSSRLAVLHAEHAAQFRDNLIKKYGLPAPLAVALAASAELESGLSASVTQNGKNGQGQGLFQITNPARKNLFKEFIGTTIERSTEDQQIRYQVHELTHSEQSRFALAKQVGSASLAAGYAYYVERPKFNFRDSADRYAVARALAEIPVK